MDIPNSKETIHDEPPSASLNLDSPETILSKDDTAIPMQSDGPTQTMTTDSIIDPTPEVKSSNVPAILEIQEYNVQDSSSDNPSDKQGNIRNVNNYQVINNELQFPASNPNDAHNISKTSIEDVEFALHNQHEPIASSIFTLNVDETQKHRSESHFPSQICSQNSILNKETISEIKPHDEYSANSLHSGLEEPEEYALPQANSHISQRKLSEETTPDIASSANSARLRRTRQERSKGNKTARSFFDHPVSSIGVSPCNSARALSNNCSQIFVGAQSLGVDQSLFKENENQHSGDTSSKAIFDLDLSRISNRAFLPMLLSKLNIEQRGNDSLMQELIKKELKLISGEDRPPSESQLLSVEQNLKGLEETYNEHSKPKTSSMPPVRKDAILNDGQKHYDSKRNVVRNIIKSLRKTGNQLSYKDRFESKKNLRSTGKEEKNSSTGLEKGKADLRINNFSAILQHNDLNNLSKLGDLSYYNLGKTDRSSRHRNENALNQQGNENNGDSSRTFAKSSARGSEAMESSRSDVRWGENSETTIPVNVISDLTVEVIHMNNRALNNKILNRPEVKTDKNLKHQQHKQHQQQQKSLNSKKDAENSHYADIMRKKKTSEKLLRSGPHKGSKENSISLTENSKLAHESYRNQNSKSPIQRQPLIETNLHFSIQNSSISDISSISRSFLDRSEANLSKLGLSGLDHIKGNSDKPEYSNLNTLKKKTQNKNSHSSVASSANQKSQFKHVLPTLEEINEKVKTEKVYVNKNLARRAIAIKQQEVEEKAKLLNQGTRRYSEHIFEKSKGVGRVDNKKTKNEKNQEKSLEESYCWKKILDDVGNGAGLDGIAMAWESLVENQLKGIDASKKIESMENIDSKDYFGMLNQAMQNETPFTELKEALVVLQGEEPCNVTSNVKEEFGSSHAENLSKNESAKGEEIAEIRETSQAEPRKERSSLCYLREIEDMAARKIQSFVIKRFQIKERVLLSQGSSLKTRKDIREESKEPLDISQTYGAIYRNMFSVFEVKGVQYNNEELNAIFKTVSSCLDLSKTSTETIIDLISKITET